MTYNLHPIFVHFPIALLFLYSIIKIIPFKKWFPNVSWRHIEVILLIVGVAGAFMALATGDTAEELMRPNRQLVDAHSTFGALATWLYGALLLGEISALINAKKYIFNKNTKFIERLLTVFDKIFCNKTVSIIIAIVALIAISVTGLLGGVIAYGVSADPFANIILKILGITL